jgi:hypothetical protein
MDKGQKSSFTQSKYFHRISNTNWWSWPLQRGDTILVMGYNPAFSMDVSTFLFTTNHRIHCHKLLPSINAHLHVKKPEKQLL